MSNDGDISRNLCWCKDGKQLLAAWRQVTINTETSYN
jgi:hypothetical protein